MPTAFVIMPFDPELDPVYTHLIEQVLLEQGFVVRRADNIESQQSILKDIVQSIYSSDLIVADLTGSNSNVYYELGIAHSLGKPVILTTQNLDEVPFDLRPYRILVYSTLFFRYDEAVERLSNYAKAFLQGSLPVGNPVTDFLANSDAQQQTGTIREPDASDQAVRLGLDRTQSHPDQSAPLENTDYRGVLDHIEAINEGYLSVAEATITVTASMNAMTSDMDDATAELNRIAQNPSHRSWPQITNVCRRMATRINAFTSDLTDANDVFSKVMDDTQDSLELLVSASVDQNQPPDPETTRGIGQLETLQGQAKFAKEQLLTVASLMDSIPRLEGRLTRALDNGSYEIRGFTANIDKLIGSIDRAINAARGRADG